jgi:thiopurine S-methyltransferase
MQADFWHQKWDKNEIGFHLPEANPLLVRYFNVLGLTKNSRVFLPLCGKTKDIDWLLTQGYQVAGAELSKIAIDNLFKTLELAPKITKVGELLHYSADNIDIFVGDIFNVSSSLLGAVDAVYDRAALVALPETMRKQYATHIQEITNQAPQLLISFDYDQSVLAGPPFSISSDEVYQHYQNNYGISLLASHNVIGGLKGKCVAIEKVWLLKHT